MRSIAAGIICARLVGALFLYSAIMKLVGEGQVRGILLSGEPLFASIIVEQGLVPANAAHGVAWGVIAGETALAALLLLERLPRVPLIIAGAFTLCLTGYMIWVHWRIGVVACGCLGSAAPTPLHLLLTRNLSVVALCGWGIAAIACRDPVGGKAVPAV
ncbi:MAG: hypothetical protein K2Q09_02655 [Phycisphaerales bacterium]|nr:hypothetical protein [Phycisphaerales bacterium]